MAADTEFRAIPTIELPSGESIPVLGMGTWCMGEYKNRRQEEIRSIHTGIDLGMTLIDTAEMYGDGATEEMIGEALHGRRDEVFLVSKVLPQNATASGTVQACERSLRRLKTDYIDMYLLHWRGSVPLENTVAAFQRLADAGKIRYWGVSNFDVDDMEELARLREGAKCQTNQVLYNLSRRGIEYDLLPLCMERRIPVMAYSPIEQGRILDHPALRKIAARHGANPVQVALAWVLRNEDVIAIPKASTPGHIVENRGSLNVVLSRKDLADLDRAFPAPTRKIPLELI